MRHFLPKFLLALFAISFTGLVSAQTNITITSCDTTITDPTNNVYNLSTTLTIQSGSSSRMSYNVEYFDVNYSSVYIYDGPTLITTLGDPFVLLNQQFGGQTTGSSITLVFFGIGQNPGNIVHFKIRIRCVDTPADYPNFQPLASLEAGGNIRAADYDNDGDKDLLIGGRVFRNDSYFDSLYFFERKAGVIDGWTGSNMCSADFDNDGDKDVFITGSSNVFGGITAPCAALYKNNGDGTFTLVTPQTFAGATRGGCSVVDFNNDGKPDICYTGSTDYFQNTSRIFKVYLNNGNMSFTDANVSLPGITGLINASMSWTDSDNDGDKDLVINGHNGSANITGLFTVNGSTFTNQNLALSGTSDGAIRWIDVNMDGKPDIVNMGVATPDNINPIVPEIFFNNGGNNFTAVTTNLPALRSGGSDWNDYDGDNDQDLAITGIEGTGGSSVAAVYKNNGNGQFTKISSLDGAIGTSALKWVDFNNDNKKDIVGPGGFFVKYMGADSFRIASLPATSNQYNPNACIIDDFNNDGKVDVLVAGGSLRDVDCNQNSSSTLVLGREWKLSGVPKFTMVKDLAAINPYPSTFIYDYYWTWGDYDSDGKMDVVLTSEPYNGLNYGGEYLVVFKNDGNDNFSLALNTAVTTLPNLPSLGVNYNQTTFVDLDNDGINEMLIPSNNAVYKRVNGQWELSYFDTNGGGGGVYFCATGDYNNDGFIDAALCGENYAALYKNDGHGRLVFDNGYSGFGIHTNGQRYRQLKWADIDNDGDLDLVMTDGILENKGNGSFLFVSSQFGQIHTDVADFNNDGFKDLVTVPTLFGGNAQALTILYNEQGTKFFNEQHFPFITNINSSGWDESAVSFDIDKDGDDDIVFSGAGGCSAGAMIIVNEGIFNSRSMYVTTPNGGEDYATGTTKNIKWFGSKIGASVKIELSRDSGLTWQAIIASAPSTTSGGSYAWNVTGPLSANCIIRITDNVNTTSIDKSNAVFTISAPTVPVANAGNDTMICQGSSVQLGAGSSSNNTYSWTSSDGSFTSAIANPVVSPLASTSYYLTVSNGTLSAKDTVIVIVNVVTVNLPDTLINACIGNSYAIGVSAQQGYTYEWSSLPAGFTSSESNPLVSPVEETYYNLLVTNTVTGCTANAYVHVIADSCVTNGVGIYPNPANTQLTVQLPPNTVFPDYFRLMNSSGAVVLNIQLINSNTPVDVTPYPTGIYYYTVKSSSGSTIQSGIISIVH